MPISITHKSGFTIVELLIVIVVIGILAAITIVAYNGIQVRAGVASLKSDTSGAVRQLAADNAAAEKYPASAGASNGGKGLKASPGTSFQYTYTAATNSYCLTATSSRKGVPSYTVSSSNSELQEGACSGHTDPNAPPPVATNMACFGKGFIGDGNIIILGYYPTEGNNSWTAACPRDVVIPDELWSGGKLTKIEGYAFANRNITSVTLSNSIESIGDRAFMDNKISTSVSIPSSVKSIGLGAFSGNQIPSASVPIGTTLATDSFNPSVFDPGTVVTRY